APKRSSCPGTRSSRTIRRSSSRRCGAPWGRSWASPAPRTTDPCTTDPAALDDRPRGTQVAGSMAHYRREVYVPASPDEVFAWHAREGAFERLVPPWERVSIVARNGGIEDGSRATLAVQIGPVRRRWVAEHQE